MSTTPTPPPQPAVPYGPPLSASEPVEVDTGPPASVGQRVGGFALRTVLVVAVTKVLPFVVKLLFRVIFRR